MIPPIGTHERGEVYQWAFFAMTELEAAMLRAIVTRRGSDADETAKAEERLNRVCAVLADALATTDYLVGNRFTIADVVAGGVLGSARKYDVLPDSPVLRSYLERLDGRPAHQRAYA